MANAAPEAIAEDRLTVLMLDYHAPIEHDVLLSHLCVEACTRSEGCPEELISRGVDYWSNDFEIFRPRYMGRSARYLVNAYKNKGIDLVSISGHHASGFSGSYGRGRFYTDQLADQLRGLPGRDAFFDTPSMVMLHGCWTDVKSGFEGDPIEYVRHIIEDTTVRAGESGRLLAAIQQIAGEEEAYRELFPNACILGYQGTQVPGGLFEIYGQIHNTLRGIEALEAGRSEALPAKFPLAEARSSMAEMERVNREIDRECRPTGWPCNLCAADGDTYSPLASALASALRSEARRLESGGWRPDITASRMREARLEDASYYANTRWSCSVAPPGTAPVYPEPIDRAPYLEVLLDLLMVDFGDLEGDVRQRIESELVHLLGSTPVDDATRERLAARLESPSGRAFRSAFFDQDLPRLSTFRQRDFFDFLAEVRCRECFEPAFATGARRVLRENAASQLRPSLGRALYARALADPSPRVRLLAASRLEPALGRDLYEPLLVDPDPRVREMARTRLVEPPSASPTGEGIDTAAPTGAMPAAGAAPTIDELTADRAPEEGAVR
ncbi:MAG: hypothetical protein MI919_27200 [Holophagales bacterium]|nr:hypothetical protein [Holophagales bacterium]